MLIRDPIHGDVFLDAAECEILDAPEVQRLRGIRQLGTASLVYPGCVHTRFDHSLGTNAVAKRILAGLERQGLAVDPELRLAIGVAALLHDATHVPFGHTLEDERRLFPRHDKGERLGKLLAGPLGERLDRLGIRPAVSAILAPSSQRPLGGADPPPWARQIVCSTIDADLLDYLRRDSYFAGLAQSYDDRIFRYFTVVGEQLVIDMAKHGMERHDARSETVQLLRMRYFLTERVYYHHTKVAAGAMVSKAVELAHLHGRLGEDELARLNDWTLFEHLRQIPTATAPDARIVRLLDRLEQRRLLKRAYVISAATVPADSRRILVARYHESGDNRRQVEQYLAAHAGCDDSEVILYCPALTVMKEAAALVRLPHGIERLNDPLAQASDEIRALETRYSQLWRLYVFAPAEHAAAVGAAAAEIFGWPSELASAAR